MKCATRSLSCRLAVAALLCSHASLLAWSATRHSPTADEVGHLPAGLSHWLFGRFDLYRVNPPLIRSIAALPVLLMSPKVSWPDFRFGPGDRPEFTIGADLISTDGPAALRMFVVARWACLPLVLLGGYACYLWSSDLYGPTAGLLSLALWCTCPNLMGHAQLITPDAGASALGLAASYAFWKWSRGPNWERAVVAGIVLGLAELAKTTWIVLFPLWAASWALAAWRDRRYRHRPVTMQVVVILATGIYIINLGYGFNGSFRRLDEFPFVSATLGGQPASGPPSASNRFEGTLMGAVRLPLPADYVRGIDVQRRDFEQGLPSYLRGQWRRTGWWYYYIYGFVVKVPLGTWALACAGLALSATGRRTGVRRGFPVLLTTPAVVLAVVSLQTGFSHHLRYALPVLPFVYVGLGSIARRDIGHRSAWRALAAACLAWTAASSLSVYPHSLSYFNELVGGPERGHEHLVDSNIDWGQDLLMLREWQDAHPEAAPLTLAYFGYMDPGSIGIRARIDPSGLPTIDRGISPDDPPKDVLSPGWYAISVGRLRGPEGKYAAYLQRIPVGRIGYSIYIYYVE